MRKRTALLVVLLFLAVGPCVTYAQGPIVYEYELSTSDERVLRHGEAIPSTGGHQESGTFVSSDKAHLYVIQFIGDRKSYVLSGLVCESALCYWAAWTFD